MSNLVKLPLEDGFKTSLSQQWTGGTGTVNVASTPNFTFPSGVTTYIVVNPGKTNVQVAEINAYDGSAKTLTVSNITLEKGASVNSTAQTHAVGSEVIISDNYQFWADIQTAINSKLGNDGSNPTTTFDLDLSGSNFRLRKDGSDMKFTDDNTPETTLTTLASGGGADQKVSITSSDTSVGVLDDKLTAGDGLSKTVINPAGAETLDLDIDITDTTIFTSTPTASKIPKSDALGLLSRDWIALPIFGNGSDGDVTTSGNATLTSDMFYDDLTISAGDTITTGGYRIFVKNTLTIEATGVIENDGGNATNGGNNSGDGSGVGGAAGTAGAGQSVPPPAASGAGGAGGTAFSGNGVAGGTGTSQTKVLHTTAAPAGGGGGAANPAGGGGAGGGGGAAGTSTNTIKNIFGVGISEYTLSENDGTAFKPCSSPGGGGGGGADDNTGGDDGAGGGGGAGGCGGFVVLYARSLVNEGSITAIGGTAGNGGNGSAGGGGGGGGTGGSGGTIITVTMTKSGSGVETVTGGTAGTGGTSGSGTAGTAGSTGGAGTTVAVDLT